MESIDETITNLYGDVKLEASDYVGGGDINDARIITLSNGEKIFLKANIGKDKSFFAAEAKGLKAIRDTGTIAVPKVIATGKDPKLGAFLLMEQIEGAAKRPDFWEIFATELAAMHKADTTSFVSGGRYGFLQDNYIGARPQKNTPCNSFIDFFREYRLKIRFEDASDYFDSDMKQRIITLLDSLDKWLVEPKQPSLVHGDLWSGNFIVGNDGKARLIDPAVYIGCAEADIAMSELFGGFPGEFYREYQKQGLLMYGYEERRDLYNLYHLLNHLATFGRSYLGSVERLIRYYV